MSKFSVMLGYELNIDLFIKLKNEDVVLLYVMGSRSNMHIV